MEHAVKFGIYKQIIEERGAVKNRVDGKKICEWLLGNITTVVSDNGYVLR